MKRSGILFWFKHSGAARHGNRVLNVIIPRFFGNAKNIPVDPTKKCSPQNFVTTCREQEFKIARHTPLEEQTTLIKGANR